MNKNLNGFVLIGMPGSGKTQLGKEAAAILDMPFADLDITITTNTGRKPGQIITEDGEAAFRKMETETLAGFAGSNVLLSTGGGIVTVSENLEMLRRIGTIIWIQRDIEEIAESVYYSKDRPLLRDRTSLDDLWAARKDLYASWADTVFENTGRIAEAAAGLASLLR